MEQSTQTETAEPTATVPDAATPAWLAGADHEQMAELAQLGVGPVPIGGEDERDAIASDCLRSAHDYALDLARFDAAEKREHDSIKARYERLRGQSQSMLQRVGSFVKHLAATAIFAGKAKSRKVGWGTYGVRKKPDNIQIDNEAAMLAWLADHHPELVNVDVTFTVADVRDMMDALFPAGKEDAQLDPRLAKIFTVVRDAERTGYSKAAVKAVVLGKKATKTTADVPPVDVPGVTPVYGGDEPWFEVEPPFDPTTAPVEVAMEPIRG